jgi:hypothetical protein
LHPTYGTKYEDGAVENSQRTLYFYREIDVSWCVD